MQYPYTFTEPDTISINDTSSTITIDSNNSSVTYPLSRTQRRGSARLMPLVRQQEIISPQDPSLRERVELYDFANPPTNTNDLVQYLYTVARTARVLAVSAPIVGLRFRAFVVVTEHDRFSVFNPEITSVSETTAIAEEMCPTKPGFFIKIKRPATVRVRMTNVDGQTVTNTVTGLTARIFQHQIDRLNGVDFITRATTFHREQANRQYKKLIRSKQ